MRPEASIEIAMYARERKKAMMSSGEMLFAPTVPSCTSTFPIARIASRKRSAIRGAVTKLRGKSRRTKSVTWSDLILLPCLVLDAW